MYRLTDLMLQNLERDLRKFHELFQGGRCQAWQLEELIAKSINSDFKAKDKAYWQGNGHDIEADIIVGNNKISVKSGKIKNANKKNEKLILSGHRLGRFEGNLKEISKFLSSNTYLLIAVPYDNEENEHGKQHHYQLIYMDALLLQPSDWKAKYSKKNPKKISKYECTNNKGVYCSISPSMSWQVWWEIPTHIIPNKDRTRIISIR